VDSIGQLLGEEVIRVMGNIKKMSSQVQITGVQKVISCPGRQRTNTGREGMAGTYVDANPVDIRLSLLMLDRIALAGVTGDGGTTWGTGRPVKKDSDERYPLDQGDTRLDEKTLREIHMQGYVSTVKAGVGSIMPSYNGWNGMKCSGSRELMTKILKEEMKFEGFLISDYAALDQPPGDYKPTGKLSHSWPRSMAQIPINVGDARYDPLFRYGFGLTY